MENKITVPMNDTLQKAVDHFIEVIKENLDIDLNTQILAAKDIDKYEELADETFDEYKVYNQELFELAGHLYDQDYDVLKLAVKEHNTSPLIVNQLLQEFVLDLVAEHQGVLFEQQKPKPKSTPVLSQ